MLRHNMFLASKIRTQQTISVLNAVTSINGSATMPTGILSGDLLIAGAMAGSGSSSTPAITVVYGTGFTAIGSMTGTYTISRFFYRATSATSYKICNGTEGGTTIGGFLNANGKSLIVFHIRGKLPIVSVSGTITTTTATTADPPAYSSTTTTASDTIVYYYANTSNGIPAISTNITPTLTATVATGVYSGQAAGVWASTSATTYTFDATDGGNMNLPMMGSLVLNY